MPKRQIKRSKSSEADVIPFAEVVVRRITAAHEGSALLFGNCRAGLLVGAF